MFFRRQETEGSGIAGYLKAEYRRGLTANGCIGLHGTSLESVKYLLNTGVLPGATKGDWTIQVPGDFFYTPLQKGGVVGPVDINEASYYAAKNGMIHYVYSRLGLGISDEQSGWVMDWLLDRIPGSADDPNYLNLLERHGWDGNKIKTLLGEARKRKGIIIGIRDVALQKPTFKVEMHHLTPFVSITHK